LNHPTGGTVGVLDVLALIDLELSRLEQARNLLKRTYSSTTPVRQAKKRRLTPEGRKRIAEAVKKRWAEHRKSKSLQLVAG
jgi:hypothetical protein